MDIPTRPTPFAKLIELGTDGQVAVFAGEGPFGAAFFRTTNAVRYGDAPTSTLKTCRSYEEAERMVAEFDEDDARAFIVEMKQHMTRKIGDPL